MPSRNVMMGRVRQLRAGGSFMVGARRAAHEMAIGIDQGTLDTREFGLRDIFESLVENGDEIVRRFDPRQPKSQIDIAEAADGWDSTAFSYLTSRIVFSQIRDSYMDPTFTLSNIIPNMPSRLKEERMPGLSAPFDEFADPVSEKMPIPPISIDDDEISSHETEKRAGILSITREAIFFDRTNMLATAGQRTGAALGLRKEKRLASTVFGLTSYTANPGKTYIYKGTAYAPYQTSTPWINSQTSNELIAWDDIDEALQLLMEMKDPVRAEAMFIAPKHLLVMPAKMKVAQTILTATTVQSIPYGGTSGTTRGNVTISPNPVNGIESYSSIIAYNEIVASGVAAATAKKYWLLGDLAKAFTYVENYPITVTQAPTNSEAEFTHDIVARFKVSERGVPCVVEPRAVVRAYA